MKTLLTIVSLILGATLTHSALADDSGIGEPMNKLDPTEASDSPKASQPVPEPRAVVALAFAGVVILARHRFRP